MIHDDDLDEGYKVELKLNSHTIILTSMVKCNFKTKKKMVRTTINFPE